MKKSLKVIKKAWSVIDNTYWYETPCLKEPEIVYADTRSEAKRLITNFEPRESSFLNIKAKRARNSDLVEFEDQKLKRYEVDGIILTNKRKKAILALPEDEEYYVQDARSFVGNSILLWGLNNAGYTTDIKKAHKYTKDEIVRNFYKSCRETDKIWFAKHLEDHVKSHVDMQYLEYKFCI